MTKTITYKMKKYRSCKELALEYGMSLPTLDRYLKEGKDLEDFRQHFVSYRGVKYKTIQEFMNTFNISYKSAVQVLRKNRDVEECKKSFIEVEGVKYRSLSAAARAYGLTYKTVKGRLKRGMSLHDAVTTTQRLNRTLSCDHLGNRYESFADMARAYGIPDDILLQRIGNAGWDIERALTTPVRKYRKRIKKC